MRRVGVGERKGEEEESVEREVERDLRKRPNSPRPMVVARDRGRGAAYQAWKPSKIQATLMA